MYQEGKVFFSPNQGSSLLFLTIYVNSKNMISSQLGAKVEVAHHWR